MKLIKPAKLEKGDTVAIISPSSNLASLFPHRVDNAVIALNKLGYKTREFPTTRASEGQSAGTAKDRAKDLMQAFDDPSIKMILCSIGGLTSNQLLRYIDFGKIRDSPKIFCGYSDISVLHYAIFTKTGLVTFYGPSAMNQFGEHPRPLNYTVDYFMKAVCTSDPIGKIDSSKEWTDEFLDWGTKDDKKRTRKMQHNPGYEWLCEGKAEGPIIGGCLPSILHMKGTEYWPKYHDSILFLELPESQVPSKGFPISYAEPHLTDLEVSGVFEEVSGLVFGRPFAYSKADIIRLKEVLRHYGKEHSFPVLFGADMGHTDPMITIPIGVKSSVNSKTNEFSIDEGGVK